jgi:hypothetical protein
MAVSAGFDGLTDAVKKKMAHLLIAPKLSSSSDLLFPDTKGAIYVRNYGTRFPFRGGNWGSGAAAGLGYLYLYYGRSSTSGSRGFRPAFIL